ncbi:MAG: chromate transporter [Caldilineaceae bacterium]
MDTMMVAETHRVRPSLFQLLRIWFLIGLQSFGGGTATLFLIRRAAVEQYGWLSPEDFTRDWALVQAAPGINLLGITILVGRRVAGMVGALVSLLGLMLPSVSITILMTALYADLRNSPVIQAALHGVVPATIGLGLLLTINMASPLLKASKRESTLNLIVGIVILVGSGLAVIVWQLPVILVLCSAGALGGLAMWYHETKQKSGKVAE